MDKVYRGRAVIKSTVEGLAVVSRGGFNTYASFYNSLTEDVLIAHCADSGNQDTFGKVLSGKILCIPNSIGSTSAGAVWQRIVSLGIAPKGVLISNTIDSLAAGGLLVVDLWTDETICVIDQLGMEFLEAVQDDDRITIQEDGTVIINHP
jgi:predicted aconitase with swiveling domain